MSNVKLRRSPSRATLVAFLAGALALSTNVAEAQKPGIAVPEVSRDKVICFALYTVHDNVLKLTAQLYLSKGLACAAYREAFAVVEAAPKAVKAYAVMRGALQKMGLKDSPLWMDLQQRTAGLSQPKRNRKPLGDR